MASFDMYHLIALGLGFLLKLLWERFIGPAPGSSNPSIFAHASGSPAGAAAAGGQPNGALASLLDNPQALTLLRELLHATPPGATPPRTP